ncbi:MAG: PilZ domain-containing protein [Nitrospiraceae bacterium]|nr:PilZ domain-containing protein [Nitrospiraceae bacterium]
MTEKRRSSRYKKKLKVDYRKDALAGSGTSRNISEEGLFINTNDDGCSPGSVIDITIHLPDGSTSRLKGVVRHTGDGFTGPGRTGLGIEFIDSDGNLRAFIDSMKAGEIRMVVTCPVCGAGNPVQEGMEVSGRRCVNCGALLEKDFNS